jgi:DNA polymerase/3'-5' exonuclease PolX
MNFKQLIICFLNKARELESSSLSGAKYRSINYKKTADIILKETESDDKVNIKKILLLSITPHMKEKAIEFISTVNKNFDARTTAYLDLKPMAKIPHDFINKFEKIVKKLSNKNLKLTIVGSYRRKKPYSSDIDIMICSNKDDAIEIFKNKIQSIFETRVYSQGISRLSMIITVKDMETLSFKIDAFKTTPDEEIPMLIYSTGSKEFNIYMRGIAKKQGYLLNQKGLFKHGERIVGLKKEEDYFKILGIKYVKPELR